MRWVSDPTSYEPLTRFACGGASNHEQAVEEALDELRDMGPEDTVEFKVRVAEARHADDLVGVSIFLKRPLGDSGEYADAVCLALTVVNEPYRGWRMPDGTSRIGTFLLCDALAQIEDQWGHPMPDVWGAVHEENKDCQNMLSRHGFWRLRDSKRDPANFYFVYLRPKDLDWAAKFSPLILNAVKQASAPLA